MTKTKNQKVFFLGCGKMGSIIAQNLVEEKSFAASQITVLKTSQQNQVPKLNYLKDTSYLPKNYQADLVFIAIKPQNATEILEKFSQEKIFHQNTIFISILAGKKIAFFSKFFGAKAKIIRSMPNLPIRDSQGIFPYLANKNINKTELKNLEKIFNNFGQAFELKNEKLFDYATALFGSGPAYIFYLQEIFSEVAAKSGIEKNEAVQLVKTLFLGSSLMSANSDLSFSELRNSVTSKAGTTEEALKVLQKNSTLKKLFQDAITSATEKSKELSK
jgi:pyrroline-5-carboxylate reductase